MVKHRGKNKKEFMRLKEEGESKLFKLGLGDKNYLIGFS